MRSSQQQPCLASVYKRHRIVAGHCPRTRSEILRALIAEQSMLFTQQWCLSSLLSSSETTPECLLLHRCPLNLDPDKRSWWSIWTKIKAHLKGTFLNSLDQSLKVSCATCHVVRHTRRKWRLVLQVTSSLIPKESDKRHRVWQRRLKHSLDNPLEFHKNTRKPPKKLLESYCSGMA